MKEKDYSFTELKHQSNYSQSGIKFYEITLGEEKWTAPKFGVMGGEEINYNAFVVSYKWYNGKREFTKYGKFFKELKKAEAYYEQKLKDCENKIR